MGERTVLTRATSKSDSLRTTVPRSIVKHFDIQERDQLEWSFEVKNSKLMIEVKPIRKSRQEPPQKSTATRKQRTLATKPAVATETDDGTSRKKRWRLR
jgi:antitoxin component of MazEF toxin-antitoxin module